MYTIRQQRYNKKTGFHPPRVVKYCLRILVNETSLGVKNQFSR